MLDKLHESQMINKVKSEFDKEVHILKTQLLAMQDENRRLKGIIEKQLQIFIHTEMRDSSIDLRPIYSQNLSSEQARKLISDMQRDDIKKE